MPTQITGVIKRITSYADGTSQVDIAAPSVRFDKFSYRDPITGDTLHGEVAASALRTSVPFFGCLPGDYLGREITFSEIREIGKPLTQVVASVGFDDAKARATKEQTDAIKTNGRVQVDEFVL